MSAAAAVGVILSHPEPLGYEVMIPHRIKPTEIVAVRNVAQKLGWRTIPGTQKASICPCPVCVPPGTVKSSRRRAQFEEAQRRAVTPEEKAALEAHRRRAKEARERLALANRHVAALEAQHSRVR